MDDPAPPQVLRDGRPLILRLLAGREATNPSGTLFGGWLLSQMDVAGSVPAMYACRGRFMTARVDEVRFLQPGKRGDLVSAYAGIDRVGRTTVHVTVELWVDRREQSVRIVTGQLTYVAVDDQGQPRPLPDHGAL